MKILLVDDEPHLLVAYSMVIKDLGDHEVIEMADGSDALRFLAEHHLEIDAIVTDNWMEIINGTEVIWTVHIEGYEIPCLLHSSDPETPGGKNLNEWVEQYPFAQFHLKDGYSSAYIKEFLNEVKNEDPNC